MNAPASAQDSSVDEEDNPAPLKREHLLIFAIYICRII
jgi:hypothetical protein